MKECYGKGGAGMDKPMPKEKRDNDGVKDKQSMKKGCASGKCGKTGHEVHHHAGGTTMTPPKGHTGPY